MSLPFALRSLFTAPALLLLAACGGAAPPAEGPEPAGSATHACKHCQHQGGGHEACEHCKRKHAGPTRPEAGSASSGHGGGHEACEHCKRKHAGPTRPEAGSASPGQGGGHEGGGHEACEHGDHAEHGAGPGGHEGCSCPHHGPGGAGGHGGPAGHAGHGPPPDGRGPEGHPGPDHPMHQGGHPRFDDPARWSKVFDDPRRDEWQKPALIVEKLALRPDAVVADLGTGTGYFVPWLSRAVPKGKVLALDVEPAMVKHVAERARTASLGNVVAALSTPTDPAFPQKPNLVLLVDTYHHIADRVPYFTRLRAGLAPGGRVAVVDFRMGDIPVGPPEAHRIAPEAVEKELGAAGFKRCASHDGLPYQYFLIFAEKC